MQKKISIKILPSEAADAQKLRHAITLAAGVTPEALSGFNILKQSIDARGRTTWMHITVNAFIHEPYREVELLPLNLRDVHHAGHAVIIVGAGPAGLFSA